MSGTGCTPQLRDVRAPDVYMHEYSQTYICAHAYAYICACARIHTYTSCTDATSFGGLASQLQPLASMRAGCFRPRCDGSTATCTRRRKKAAALCLCHRAPRRCPVYMLLPLAEGGLVPAKGTKLRLVPLWADSHAPADTWMAKHLHCPDWRIGVAATSRRRRPPSRPAPATPRRDRRTDRPVSLKLDNPLKNSGNSRNLRSCGVGDSAAVASPEGDLQAAHTPSRRERGPLCCVPRGPRSRPGGSDPLPVPAPVSSHASDILSCLAGSFSRVLVRDAACNARGGQTSI